MNIDYEVYRYISSTYEHVEPSQYDMISDAYKQGATDQKNKDLEKSWEYVKGIIKYASSGGDITHITKEHVIKAMEE